MRVKLKPLSRIARNLGRWLGLSFTTVVLVGGLMVGAAFGGLMWLAAAHTRAQPLDLLPYLPRVQSFLADRGLDVSFDTLQLYYDTAPVLRAEGIRVKGADGDLAVYGEAAAIRLAKGRLLRFAIAPKMIEARGVTLRLVRTQGGVVTIAGFPVGGESTAQNPDDGLVEWLEALPSDTLWGRLKQIRAEGLTLLLRDDLQRAEWVLEDGKLAIERYEESGERGSLIGKIRRLTGPHLVVPRGVKGTPIPVLVGLGRIAGANEVRVEAKFGDINAAVIGDYLPPTLQETISGQGTMALGSTLMAGNRLGEPWLTLRLKQATLNLPAAAGYSKPLVLPRLEATVSYRPAPADTLTIHQLALTAPRGNLFVVSGTVLNLTSSPTLNLTGFSPGGDIQALVDFYPDANPKVKRTYQWLRQNLQEAQYRNLIARVGLKTYAFPKCADTCGPLMVDAIITGGTVQFMDDFPPAKIITSTTPARFFWRGQTIGVVAPAATVGNQRASDVHVFLNNLFSPSPTMVYVSSTVAGSVPELINRLNALPELREPIPGTYSGQHSTALNIWVPLVRNVTPTFASTAILLRGVVSSPTVAGLPFIGAVSLTAPSATLSLSANKTLRIEAPRTTVLGGDLAVVWQQNLQPGQPNAMQLNASGTVAGAWVQQLAPQVVSATGGVIATLQTWQTSPERWAFNLAADAKGSSLTLPVLNYRKAAGQPLQLKAEGSLVPGAELVLQNLSMNGHEAKVSGMMVMPLRQPEQASITLPNFTLGATQTSVRLAGGTLTLRGDALDVRGLEALDQDDPILKNLVLDASLGKIIFSRGTLQRAVIQANLRNSRWQLQRLTGQVAGGGSVSLLRQGNRLTVNVPNLGETLKTTGVYDRLEGGQLFGTLVYRTPTEAVGELKLLDFSLKNPPTMMKVLGLLSLEQLVAGTDSTKFNRAILPMRLNDDALSLNNALLTGPSMDLRLSGQYWRGKSELDFNGSLAPALPFNRLVSKVPLLGTLLTGSQDGLVVADFRLSGPTDDPKVTVRPLSILTPGLLKDLFRGGQSNDLPINPATEPR